jgi:hypothetical protein
MSTQLAMVVKVLVATTRTSYHTPLHVSLSSPLDWRILLDVPPLKPFRLVAYGLLLLARCLKMTFLLAK